jgi:DAK2 domain fusion protein YloV
MSDAETVRVVTRGALAALEAARGRIDDLNVYPVPDGDTGTNLTLTVRALVDELERTTATERAQLAREATRAALMGARGNSGVIFSQIVRGAADVLADDGPLDVPRALRSASDAAYRAVRRPVEGTMLSVVRELAEEAESRPADDPADLWRALVRRGEEAVARTPEQLDVLREAGVVDAGGAGLLELVRGIASAVSGEEIPPAPAHLEAVSTDAIHQELSRYRYCTVFVVEGDDLDVGTIERELEQLGDSLLVVGDRTAVKVHVHTDEPGVALSLATRAGFVDGVEIANMHRQTEQREARLSDAAGAPTRSGVVAVVAGDGNRRLFESLGAARVVEGGQTMNPSTADLVAAVRGIAADEVLVLPNNSNVILAAEQAARLADRPVRVVHADSIPAGLAAMVAFDAERGAEENAAEMNEALAAVHTGEVTVASRDVEMNGLAIRKGAYLGLADGKPVAGGASFDEVADAVVERLLAEPREVLTVLTGEGAPELEPFLARVSERHPELAVDLREGGQPHYPLLLSAE